MVVPLGWAESLRIRRIFLRDNQPGRPTKLPLIFVDNTLSHQSASSHLRTGLSGGDARFVHHAQRSFPGEPSAGLRTHSCPRRLTRYNICTCIMCR